MELLETPAVIVDLDIAERNIASMAALLKAHGIAHRPHIKTAKSVALARKQIAAGAIGITVAKLAEAEVFARAGFADMLIAHAIFGETKLQRFAALHCAGRMVTTVDSDVVAQGLSRVGVETGKPVDVLVEIDGGLHRGGRQPGQDCAAFAQAIAGLPGIRIKGVMGYFGTIYRHAGRGDLLAAAREEARTLREAVALLRDVVGKVDIVSAGSSPSALFAGQLGGVTEVRAGNYLFWDASGVAMGLAREDDCALRVVTTVISTPVPGRATIDAGSKTLSSDRSNHRPGFGIVVGRPAIRLVALNEEHGMLEFDPAQESLSVGDRLVVIPNHSCVVPNLCDRLYGIRDGQWVETLAVDARGCNY
ncbi:alanine racemase [Paenibacillus cymbidii]|uniref:alanine racemase n=1 Tax=Paenibacillus cymbidii TaxID=1639034 RepID=UPI0010800955|nr:alanine racemase [Paenibacillus cymbidii]